MFYRQMDLTFDLLIPGSPWIPDWWKTEKVMGSGRSHLVMNGVGTVWRFDIRRRIGTFKTMLEWNGASKLRNAWMRLRRFVPFFLTVLHTRCRHDDGVFFGGGEHWTGPSDPTGHWIRYQKSFAVKYRQTFFHFDSSSTHTDGPTHSYINGWGQSLEIQNDWHQNLGFFTQYLEYSTGRYWYQLGTEFRHHPHSWLSL